MPLHPEALAFVSYGIVLDRVRVRGAARRGKKKVGAVPFRKKKKLLIEKRVRGVERHPPRSGGWRVSRRRGQVIRLSSLLARTCREVISPIPPGQPFYICYL